MKTRLDFMTTFYRQVAAELVEIPVKGKSNMAKLMYLLVLGDYISYYLAILRNIDPTPVSIINQLKHTMQKI
jgi:glucose/mannose-6-phosphate isomerase